MSDFKSISYEPQRPANASERRCGAAALVMVYRALGRQADQQAVFRDLDGSSRTYRLAGHAMAVGLSAAVVRFRDPWEPLLRLPELLPEAVTILNHRLDFEEKAGHFSVFLRTEQVPEEQVVIHDPQRGPQRRLTKEMFLRLWNPSADDSEIRGRIAVLIRPPLLPQSPEIVCRRCHKVLTIEAFASVLPLISSFYCPHCDARHDPDAAVIPFRRQ